MAGHLSLFTYLPQGKSEPPSEVIPEISELLQELHNIQEILLEVASPVALAKDFDEVYFGSKGDKVRSLSLEYGLLSEEEFPDILHDPHLRTPVYSFSYIPSKPRNKLVGGFEIHFGFFGEDLNDSIEGNIPRVIQAYYVA